MTRWYIVTRHVKEKYSVRIDSEKPPTRKQVKDAAEDPYEVSVTRETVAPDGDHTGAL